MEIIRKKNTATTFVFPLVTSGSNNYYTTSAWTSLTNRSISGYSWSDTVSPSIFTLSQTPTQLSATGLWSLSATAAEMNPSTGAHDYISVKLKADQIQEQTLLVLLTDYSMQKLADTTNKINANAVSVSAGTITTVTGNVNGSVGSVTGGVTVTTNNDKSGYNVNSYTNFPKVTVSAVDTGVLVSADFATDYYNKIQSLTSNVTIGEVTVSAYKNFPQVNVSAGTITNVTNGVTVTTNNDKSGYNVNSYTNFPQVNVSAGTITTVTGNVVGSVGSVVSAVVVSINNDKTGYSIVSNSDKSGYNVNPVSVSAYTNFPQVTVSTNLDKTNYTVSSGSITTVTGGVTVTTNNDKTGYSVTAQTNHPSVNVSSVDNGALVSADFSADYYNKIQTLTPTIAEVTVSAYKNFPQVNVSAGTITTVTGNVNGSVGSVTGGVTVTTNNDKTGYSVTAQTNHPAVSVSAVTDKTGYSIVSNSDKSGYNVNPVSVSAYTNFPQVTVSTNLDKTNYTVSSGSITTVTGGVTVTTNNDKTGYSVTAQTNHPAVSVSAVTDKTGYSLTTVEEDAIVSKVWDKSNALHLTSGSTGYNVSLLPNINSNVGVAVAGVPSNFIAVTDQIVNGTLITGSVSSTWYDNGVYWQTRTSGTSALDCNLTFQLGSTRASQVTVNGRFQAGPNRFVNVFAYNYSLSAYTQLSDSLNRMNNSTSDTDYTYNLLNSNKSSTGQVKIRFQAGQTNAGDDLYIDQVLVKGVAAGATPEEIAEAVYNKMSYTVYDGKIWIDTNIGTAGTDLGIHGIPTNPVNNLVDALVLASKLNVKYFYCYPKTSLTLTQSFADYIFDGFEYDIYLNGQNCDNTTFNGAEVQGLAICQSIYDIHFNNCYCIDLSANNTNMKMCELIGSTCLTSGNHVWDRCIDATNILITPTIHFQDAATLQMRKYSGGILVKGMTSVNDFIIDGAGRIIIDATCTGGTVTIRGNYSITDNSGVVTITKDANYSSFTKVNSNPVTVSAYTNFPQVYVSAIAPGIEVSATVAIDYNKVMSASMSAIDNKFTFSGADVKAFATNMTSQVNIGEVTVSAYKNFPQVNVSAGTITNVTGNVNGSVGYVVSAVVVSINNDKSGYNVNPVTVAAITDGVITSADFSSDYYNKVQSLSPTVTIGDVTVSAYKNFPQVSVSAMDTTVTTTIQNGLATSADIVSLNNAVTAVNNAISLLNDLSDTDIQLILGLDPTNTISEIATLPTNPTIAQAVMLDYIQRRNKQVTNSLTSKVETYNNAGVKIMEATIADDGTSFTKDKLGVV